MDDVFDQLEACEKREERERDLLLTFVHQVAAGQFNKGRAIVQAKSLLRGIATPAKRVVIKANNLPVYDEMARQRVEQAARNAGVGGPDGSKA